MRSLPSLRRRYPLHRWLQRLAERRLSPVVVCVAEGVHHSYETDLCEALVEHGVPLLNVRPSCSRTSGRVIVDIERGRTDLVNPKLSGATLNNGKTLTLTLTVPPNQASGNVGCVMIDSDYFNRWWPAGYVVQ